MSQTSLPKGNSLSLAAGYPGVWVPSTGVTYQVNEVTGRIVRAISTPGTRIGLRCDSGIAAGAGAVGVTHGCRGIYRIDPRHGRSSPRCGSPALALSRSPMAWCG